MVITLTTDFGFQDAYVAAMKGVILDINPKAVIVDICHSVQPQNIGQAAFLLSTAYCYFPKETIHVVVVDPEVGSQRRAIVLKAHEACFVAPDNGVLSYVVRDASDEGLFHGGETTALPRGVEAVEIANPRFWRHPVSTTFHGRDIFAPVAAHLSLGIALQELGKAIASVRVLPLPRPHPTAEGALTGHVLHVDGFGNVITNLRQQDLGVGISRVQVGGRHVGLVGTTYASAAPGQPVALIGSSGYLEIAVRDGSAASMLGVDVGDEVTVYT